jgi:anaerobic ribonucleoside-triphosphate reductase
MNCPHCESEIEEMVVENDVDGFVAGTKVGVCHSCKKLFTSCEIWSRVCGFLRPTDGWNPGKKAEFDERVEYINLGK